MKLILLLLAIYSLIFYQSYKIEKLKDNFLNTKERLATKKVYQNPAFQNAILYSNDNNSDFSYPNRKKQAILRRAVFY